MRPPQSLSTARAAALPALIALLAGCSGGGNSNGSAPPPAAQTMQRVAGTMIVGASPQAATANARSRDYVSAATKHAALFIDGAATAAGSTTTCSSSGCTISWAATLNVPGNHTFAVEIDDNGTHPGTSGTTPYVEAEGSGSYAVVAGSGNALSALALNGLAASFSYSAATCASNKCSGTIHVVDADFDAITYSGAAYTTPGEGQSPTSGQVFDNDGGGTTPLTLQSDTSSIGVVNGTSASPYASFNADQSVLDIVGVDASGAYGYSVGCVSGASGQFGLKFTSGKPSQDVTAAELAGLSPAVSYGVGGASATSEDLTSVFTCTNGQISTPGAASGSLPVD